MAIILIRKICKFVKFINSLDLDENEDNENNKENHQILINKLKKEIKNPTRIIIYF